MKISGLDARYSVNLEYCGHETPHYVVRFCGDFLGENEDLREAEKIAIVWNHQRDVALCGL